MTRFDKFMDNIKEQGFKAIGITDRDELLFRRKVQPPPWVSLTDKEVNSIEECALTKRMAIAMTSATLKEKNT